MFKHVWILKYKFSNIPIFTTFTLLVLKLVSSEAHLLMSHLVASVASFVLMLAVFVAILALLELMVRMLVLIAAITPVAPRMLPEHVVTFPKQNANKTVWGCDIHCDLFWKHTRN